MEFLEYIKQLSDEELYREVSSIIKQLEEESKEINVDDFFGFKLSSNYENYHTQKSLINLKIKCMYDGYIPLNTKVIYGVSIDKLGMASNNGLYYTIDDDSYIYDFCKYIRNIDVANYEDLFEYILLFLKNHFGTFKFVERDDMFKVIMKDEMTSLEPVKEHKLSKFKGKGNALCSEYSILANNILNVFGVYSCVFLGQLKLPNKGRDGHAFNLISFKEKDEEERKEALIDFSNGVNVYDFSYNKIGESPFIRYFESIEDTVNGFLENDLHLTCDEYDYMVLGRSLVQMFIDRQRDYSSCGKVTVNIGVKVKQKEYNVI